MKRYPSIRIMHALCILLIYSCSALAEGWSSPTNLSDPGQWIGGSRSVSNQQGDSITLWWDLGENALVSTRLSFAGGRSDMRVATSQPESGRTDFEIAANASMSKIVAVYPQRSPVGLNLQFVRSDDGGASWSKPVQAAPRLQNARLLVSRDFQKVLLVGTFGPESSQTLQSVRSLDGGVTWSIPEVLTTQIATSRAVSVAAAADEDLERVVILVGYSSQSDPSMPYTTQTLGLVSSDSGFSWSPQLSLDDWAIRQAQLMPSSGQLVAVAERVSEGGSGEARSLGVIRATGVRGEWLAPVVLEESRYNSGVTRVVTSADGATLAFGWSSGISRSGDHLVNIATSTDGGLSWRNGAPVGSHSGTAAISTRGLHMSTDGTRLVMMWSAASPTDARSELLTAHSADSGLTWTAPTVHGEVLTTSSRKPPLADLLIGKSAAPARLVFMHPTALMTSVSEDGGVSWSDPSLLSRPVYPAYGARLLRISNLELLATWGRYRHSDSSFIEHARSDDGGVTWSQPQVLFDRGSASIGGTYTASGGGLVFVMWNERSGGSYRARLARSLDAGRTWVTDELGIVPPDSQLVHMQIAKGSGRAMIFFMPMFGTFRTVRALVSTDSGATWGEVPLGVTNSRLIDSVMSRDGLAVQAAFVANDGSERGPEIRTSWDGGLSWNVSQSPPSASNLSLNGKFQSSDDGMNVAFLSAEKQGFFHRITVRYTVNGGLTWSSSLFESIQGIDGRGRLVATGSEDGQILGVAWKSGIDMLFSVSNSAGADWTFPAALFPLPSINLASPNDGALFRASRDGRRLVLLGILRQEPGPIGSGYMEVVTANSSDSGLTWRPRSVISSNSFIEQLSLEVSDDASSAAALWIASSGFDSGLRGAHVQAVSGRELNVRIFYSGFEQ